MSKPKTIKVRIAVAMDEDGCWHAIGHDRQNERESMNDALEYAGNDHCDYFARYWVTAKIPLPTAVEVEGTVEKAKGGADAE